MPLRWYCERSIRNSTHRRYDASALTLRGRGDSQIRCFCAGIERQRRRGRHLGITKPQVRCLCAGIERSLQRCKEHLDPILANTMPLRWHREGVDCFALSQARRPCAGTSSGRVPMKSRPRSRRANSSPFSLRVRGPRVGVEQSHVPDIAATKTPRRHRKAGAPTSVSCWH